MKRGMRGGKGSEKGMRKRKREMDVRLLHRSIGGDLFEAAFFHDPAKGQFCSLSSILPPLMDTNG